MSGYLKRLARTTAAYQVADVVAKVIALALLPLYTRYLTPRDYGTAELLLTLIISVSIVVRLGLIEAFVRFHFVHEDDAGRRRVSGAAFASVLAASSAAALAMAIFAGPVSELALGYRDATLLAYTALGVWTFTNLEMANALLRVEERTRAFLVGSLTNVALTVSLTLVLVVGLHQGARGLVLGNFGASGLVLLGLWVALRDRLGFRVDPRALGPMLRFGLPTVPAEVSVFALNVVDRYYLYRVQGAAEAGLYSLAIKLAAVIILLVRAFQYAWPPLAYSITDDEEARRVYAFATTYYVLLCGLVVAGITLVGRWVVRLFAAPQFYPAHVALPWVALGWALYGLFLVLVVLAGRAKVTSRNVIAAGAGLVVNVVALVTLVGPLGIAGAGIALCVAYFVMLGVMYALTRDLFPVAFEWGRLVHLALAIGAPTVAAELLLPTSGALGLLARTLVVPAILGLLAATRFFRPEEVARLRALRPRARRARPAAA